MRTDPTPRPVQFRNYISEMISRRARVKRDWMEIEEAKFKFDGEDEDMVRGGGEGVGFSMLATKRHVQFVTSPRSKGSENVFFLIFRRPLYPARYPKNALYEPFDPFSVGDVVLIEKCSCSCTLTLIRVLSRATHALSSSFEGGNVQSS